MIEVLHFGLSEGRGGIETYLKKIWKNIDHSRFHFNFIDMTGEDKLPCFYDELVASGCTFYKITSRRVSIKKNREDIRKLFRDNHFDIFHFSVNTLSYVLPVEEALKNGVKVIVHSRNGGASNRLLTKFLHYINKIRIKKLDVNRIAVSPKAGEWLFGKSPFEVYYNGVEVEQYIYSEEKRAIIRESLGCEDNVVIANVGAFLPAKNHPFMVNVFEQLHKKMPNAKLWFIGDGPLRPQIESLVEEKGLSSEIQFLGERKDMDMLYSGMDLFWFPSLFEGFGNVILEAECSGVACLMSDCIPLDAKVADNAYAYSLEHSVEQWVDKMQEVIRGSKTDRSKGYLQVVQAGFSVEEEIERLEALYSNLNSR